VLIWDEFLARKEIESANEIVGYPRGWFREGDCLPIPNYVVEKFVPTVADYLLDAIFSHRYPQLPPFTSYIGCH